MATYKYGIGRPVAIISLIYAALGREKEIPVFGDRTQGWFEKTIN